MDEQTEKTHSRPKRPTPQFKYIPPPQARSQHRLAGPSGDQNGEFKPVYIPRNNKFSDVLKSYVKENPLVPIGLFGIAASLVTGMTLFYRGVHPKWEERMMWSRCGFQAFTVMAIGYSEYKRVKEAERIFKLYTPEQINEAFQKRYGFETNVDSTASEI